MKITKRIVLGLLVGLSFVSCNKEDSILSGKSLSDTWELTVNGDQTGEMLEDENMSLTYNFEDKVIFGDKVFKSFSWIYTKDGVTTSSRVAECRVTKIKSNYGNPHELEIKDNPVDYALTMEIHSYTKSHLILMVNPGEENERLWTFEKQ